VRERREELVLQPARFLGRREAGELSLLAARDHHADAAHPHRAALFVIDAPLALAPAHRAIRRDNPVLDVVRHAVGQRPLYGREHLAAIVGMDLALVAGERPVERACREAVNARQIVGPLHGVGAEIPIPRAHRRRVQRKPETLLAAAGLFLGPGPFERKRHLCRDDARQLQVVAAGRGRRIEIQHELADDAIEADQGDERQRRDPFAGEDRPIGFERVVGRHVRYPDRLRIWTIRFPRRVAFHRAAVRLGQTAERLESHDAIGIEQENGRTLDAEPGMERVERRPVYLMGGSALAHGAGQAQTGRDVLRSRCRHPALNRVLVFPSAMRLLIRAGCKSA
jgi:hypothetical protein